MEAQRSSCPQPSKRLPNCQARRRAPLVPRTLRYFVPQAWSCSRGGTVRVHEVSEGRPGQWCGTCLGDAPEIQARSSVHGPLRSGMTRSPPACFLFPPCMGRFAYAPDGRTHRTLQR